MKLSDLTRENAQYILDSRGECEVLTPFMDSRKKVEKGLFFCISGARFDAHTFAEQAVAHTDGLWNFLGMLLVGFASALLGGCPLRQLVLAGEGSSDSVSAVLGLLVGAAFCHNFGLASSGAGPTANGKIAVLLGLAVVSLIACANTFRKDK